MKKLRYPGMVIGSTIIYGTIPTLMKLTFPYGGNGILSTLYTCLFALPVLYLWMRKEKVSLRVSPEIARKLLILSLGTCPTSIMLYLSYSYLPVGMATTLHFIYPAAAAVYLFVFYHEHFSLVNLLALVMAFAGVICLSVSHLAGDSVVGMVLAVGSGLTWAFYIVYLDRSGLTSLPPCQLNFYMALANCVVSAVLSVTMGKFAIYSSVFIWPVVVATGILQRVIANALCQKGLSGTKAFTTSILSTFEPLTSLFVGALFLNESLTAVQLVGTAMILGAILLNLLPGRRAS